MLETIGAQGWHGIASFSTIRAARAAPGRVMTWGQDRLDARRRGGVDWERVRLD